MRARHVIAAVAVASSLAAPHVFALSVVPNNAASTQVTAVTTFYFPTVAQTCPNPTAASGSACFTTAGATVNTCAGVGASYSAPNQIAPVSVGGAQAVSLLNPFNMSPAMGGSALLAPPATQDVNATDPNVRDAAMQFNISNTTPLATIAASAPSGYVIRVEVVSAGAVTSTTPLPLLQYTTQYNTTDQTSANPGLVTEVNYPGPDGTPITIGIPLRDLISADANGSSTGQSQNSFPTGVTFPITGFCNLIASIAGSTDGPTVCSPINGTALPSITLKFGIMMAQANATLETATTADTLTQQVALAACPPGATATAGAFTQVVPQLSVVAGDQQVTVTNNTTPISTPDGDPIVGLQLMANNTYPVTTGAPIVRPMGSPNGGAYSVTGLPNNQQQCFSFGYVNAAGFMTTDASWDSNLPFPGNTGGMQSACATPSQIDGFLNRSTCFIATAAYGEEWDDRLEALRQFRDQILDHFAVGRRFTNWYYSWSPSAAHWLLSNPSYKSLVRVALLPVVESARVSLWLRANMWVFGIALFIGTGGALAFGMRRRTSA